MRTQRLLLLGLGAWLAPLGLLAQSQTSDAVVELPPFVVAESAIQPTWRYVEMPGVQILSSCAPRITQDFADSYYRVLQLLGKFVPENLRLQTAMPQTIILVSEEQDHVTREVTAAMLRYADVREVRQAATEDLIRAGGGSGKKRAGGDRPRSPQAVEKFELRFLPNLRLWDAGANLTFTILREGEFDHRNLSLTAEYLRFLLEQRTPPLPRWFVEGMMTLYSNAILHQDAAVFSRVVWISEEETDFLRKNAAFNPLAPLRNIFTPPPTDDPRELARRRREDPLQAAIFIRWAIDPLNYPRAPKRSFPKEALWNFVDRTSRAPLTDEVFAECFKLDFKTVNEPLRLYFFQAAIWSSFRLKPGLDFKPFETKVRLATPAEIGRIRGDWERIAVSYVAKKHPQFVEQYSEQAKKTLAKAHAKDPQDPQLLAVMGLMEVEAGNDAAAQTFLEAAIAANVIRPRAYYELARIRFETALFDAATGNDRALHPDKIAEMMQLLGKAREQAPPLAQVYQLHARILRRLSSPPGQVDLAVLDAGRRFFPNDASLDSEVEALFAQHRIAFDPGLPEKK
jgi:hypothetical protein